MIVNYVLIQTTTDFYLVNYHQYLAPNLASTPICFILLCFHYPKNQFLMNQIPNHQNHDLIG